jgi:hypothetical protein
MVSVIGKNTRSVSINTGFWLIYIIDDPPCHNPRFCLFTLTISRSWMISVAVKLRSSLLIVAWSYSVLLAISIRVNVWTSQSFTQTKIESSRWRKRRTQFTVCIVIPYFFVIINADNQLSESLSILCLSSMIITYTKENTSLDYILLQVVRNTFVCIQ